MTLRPLIPNTACAAAAVALALAAPASAVQREASWASAEMLAAARAEASLVVVAFIESARHPRGSSGWCPADGRIVRVERGGGLAFSDAVSVSVPCAASRNDARRDLERPVPMALMWGGNFARLYFDASRRLVDYEPLRLEPAPLPPHWQRAPQKD